MQQKDACNFILVADRKLSQAFIEDMSGQGAFIRAKEELGPEGSGEPVVGELVEQAGGSEKVESRYEWGQIGHVPTCRDPRRINSWQNGEEPPPSGTATHGFIRETLPELLRLSKTLERLEGRVGDRGT